MSNNFHKKFKSIDEQVDYLVKTKNIAYSELIKEVLLERSYSSIINPYKKLFSKGKDDNGHVYIKNVNFLNYIEIAALDDLCSSKIYEWIGIFERKLKIVIAYVIAEHLNHLGDDEGTSYVTILNDYFNYSSEDVLTNLCLEDINIQHTKNGIVKANEYYLEQRKELLHKIYDLGSINKTSKNRLVKYYQLEHKKVPFWLMVHELTLGELQLLYNMLKKETKEKVYKMLFVIDKKISSNKLIQFSGQLESIRVIRNIVSHYESLFSYLDNCDEKYISHAMTVLQLLKSNANLSIVASSALPNLNNFMVTGYNNRQLNIYNELIHILDKEK